MWILKVLLFIWPFIKEMVLGEKSMKEAFKDNKQKLMIAFSLIALIGLNMFLLTRLWSVSAYAVNLQKQVQTVGKTKPLVQVSPSLQPVTPVKEKSDSVSSKSVPSSPPNKSRSEKSAQTAAVDKNAALRAKKLKESFDKIKKREEAEGSV